MELCCLERQIFATYKDILEDKDPHGQANFGGFPRVIIQKTIVMRKNNSLQKLLDICRFKTAGAVT